MGYISLAFDVSLNGFWCSLLWRNRRELPNLAIPQNATHDLYFIVKETSRKSEFIYVSVTSSIIVLHNMNEKCYTRSHALNYILFDEIMKITVTFWTERSLLNFESNGDFHCPVRECALEIMKVRVYVTCSLPRLT
jgi:hypothetical protein